MGATFGWPFCVCVACHRSVVILRLGSIMTEREGY